MNILGTGLSGMVGGAVVEQLQNTYSFQNLSLEVGVDITDSKQVDTYISGSDAPWVLHFAAKTQVDEAEMEKNLGQDGPTWRVNVGATEILADACRRYHKKLLYISTDFVFAGGEKVYTEEDIPQPIGWYAQTKYEGEKIVSALGQQAVIVRIAFPYGKTVGPKKDFVGRLCELFEQKKTITTPMDQFFTPTYIDDIAKAIDNIILHNSSGIYHVVGSGTINSYDAAKEIAEVFGYDQTLVKKTTVHEYYKDRAPRATSLYVSNSKYVSTFGVTPLPFKEGIQQLKANGK